MPFTCNILRTTSLLHLLAPIPCTTHCFSAMIAQRQATRAAAAASSTGTVRTPLLRHSVRVRVSTETSTETSAPPAVDFTPNTQAATGYVDFDTAGQSNMYPVITRAYETGSDQDTLDTNSANLVVGVGAGLVACAVLAFGLLALTQQGAAPDAGLEQFKSLSEYAAAFSAEL